MGSGSFFVDKNTKIIIIKLTLLVNTLVGVIMPRTGLSKEEIVEKAAKLANERGLSYLSITTLADYLGIRKPSLYNHINTIEDMHRSLMIYGWRMVSDVVVKEINFSDEKTNLMEYGRKFYEFAIDNPGVFEAMLWYNKYSDETLLSATEGLYEFFFEQTDGLGINREISNHLLRTYRAFLEGFIMLQIHNSFGNPISLDKSFEISMSVLISGMEKYRENMEN